MSEIFFPDTVIDSCGAVIVFGSLLRREGAIWGGEEFTRIGESRQVRCRCGRFLTLEATHRSEEGARSRAG
jgi:hypothetical protein